MKIGIVGGTGGIGEGMALRFSQQHSVLLGSRELDKADTCSKECTLILSEKGLPCTLSGCVNQEAIDDSDVVILAIPFRFVEVTLRELHNFEDKIVVSPVNPLERSRYFYYAPPPEGSAGLLIKKLLPPTARLCVAFNTIAANRWRALDQILESSVAVCGDDNEAKKFVIELAQSVPNLEAVDAGPLEASSMVESLTPLLLTIGQLSNRKDVGVLFR